MAKKTFKRKTAEEKQEELQQLLDTLQEGVLNFEYEPERFKAILAMQALFPSYSFKNRMLTRQQKPHASYIASFNDWKSLNRFVKKGEQALRIFAPRFKKEKNNSTGEEEDKLTGFVAVPVFDISQTEGDPLPIDGWKLELNGESDEAIHIFEWVKLLANEDDCPVSIGNAEGACGYYDRLNHLIMIDESLSINHRAKTAVHELVHSRVHRYDEKASKKEKECVAEGVAFMICSYFGLDTSDYSFEYVRGWSQDKGESLLKYGTIIEKTAETLIADFERVASAIIMPTLVQGAAEEESNKQLVA